MNEWITRPALAGLVAICGLAAAQGAQHDRTIVYAMDNDARANKVFAWQVRSGGNLTNIGRFRTGGRGTGTSETPGAGPVDGIDPLASQGSLTLSPNGRWLLATNAGSGSISVMRVLGDGKLRTVDVVSTRGTSPVSVTAHGRLIYVVNVNDPAAGRPATLTGFVQVANGSLRRIAGSEHLLSGPTARPSEVSFTPDGSQLIVTERETNVVSVFGVRSDGTLTDPVSTPSPRPVPFGFDFAGNGTFVVSEAAAMDPAGASASSYMLSAANGGPAQMATVISPGVLNGQMASCWTTVSPDGTRAYVSNTGSDTVTTYAIGQGGALTLSEAATPTGVAGGAPIDAGIDGAGTRFYQLLGATGMIAVFSVNSGGDLSLIGVRNTGLPTLGSQGLAVLR